MTPGARLLRGAATTEVFALLLACALLFAWIGTVPGLHGDEAWNILTAYHIAAGTMRPFTGMTSYSGALYDYLLVPVLAWGDWSTPALRAFAATCNLAALGFAFAALRHAEPSVPARRWTALLLATSPIYVVLSRYAVEVTALTPLFSAIALWLLCGASTSRRLFLAGLAFGIAGYNHALALALPLALAAIALLFDRKSWLTARVLVPLACGFALGFAPRIVAAFFVPMQMRPQIAPPAEDLLYLPWAFFRTVDGSLLYRWVTGQQWLWVIPYAALALVGIAILRHAQGAPWQRRDAALAALVFGLAVAMALISPSLAPRYFLLPGLLFAVLLARLAAPLFDGRYARAAHAVLGATLALNLAYLAVDYFATFRNTGGGLAEVRIGKRSLESSHEFVPSDALYRQLVDRGIEQVICDRFIGWPLAVHDLAGQRLLITIAELQGPTVQRARAAVVAYAARTTRPQLNVQDAQIVDAGGVNLYRDRSFDHRFAVFVTR